jgi:hypothetical protein
MATAIAAAKTDGSAAINQGFGIQTTADGGRRTDER